MTSMPYSPLHSAFAPSGAASPDAFQFEMQTINAFLQDAAAAAIRKLSAYIEANSVTFAPLAAIAPVVSQAADAFRDREYARAFAHAYFAYRQILAMRATVPDLPNP